MRPKTAPLVEAAIWTLDKVGDGLWRATRHRFQWPSWLMAWAWDWRARMDCPADPAPR